MCANVRQSGSGSDRFLTNDDFNPDVTCFAYPWTHARAPTLSGLPERRPCICPHHLDPVHPDYSHSEIAVYTDGSFDPQDEQPNAKFAVFEVYPGDDALRLIDWYADRVCLDPLDPCWIGATIDSIRAGEATALVWALLWLCAHGMPTSAMLYSDASSVLHSGMGLWNFDLEDQLMQRLRATCMLARTMWKSRKLHMAHVKAHDGHVGNEVADLVARMVRIGKLEAREPPIAHPLWYHGAPPRILNAWLLWEGIDQPTHLPPMQGGHIATTHPEVCHSG